MTIERRRHLRVLVPGAYCELLVGAATVGLVSIEDVSDSGVFVAVPRPSIPERTAVQLRFIEEKTPFVVDGTIAQVVRADSGRTPGYGIELRSPPADTVERVVSVRKSPATPAAAAPPAALSAVILGPTNGQGPAMAQALSLFGIETLFAVDPKVALASMAPRVRIVLVELRLLEVATGVALTHLRAAAPKARLMVAVERLPDVDARAQLLRQGADELLLLPYDPFSVMGKMHAVARRQGSLGRR